MKSPSDSEPTISEKVAIRNNWLKIFVVVVATVLFSVKIWQADFSQALETVDFSDLLALLLAIFSISLAVLFYLKATDTSNVFYDNTYRFTRDVSEILGRVEAGFGEKLAHLDAGYSGLKTAVEQIPFDKNQAEKDIEEEEQQLHKVERERLELLESLAERARLEGEEKERLFNRLKQQDRELTSARREIGMLRRRMDSAELEDNVTGLRMRDYLKRQFLDRIHVDEDTPMGELNELLKNMIANDGFPRGFVRELQRSGWIDEDHDLTARGRHHVRVLLS